MDHTARNFLVRTRNSADLDIDNTHDSLVPSPQFPRRNSLAWRRDQPVHLKSDTLGHHTDLPNSAQTFSWSRFQPCIACSKYRGRKKFAAIATPGTREIHEKFQPTVIIR